MISFKLQKGASLKKEAVSVGALLIILGAFGAFLVSDWFIFAVVAGGLLMLAGAIADE